MNTESYSLTTNLVYDGLNFVIFCEAALSFSMQFILMRLVYNDTCYQD